MTSNGGVSKRRAARVSVVVVAVLAGLLVSCVLGLVYSTSSSFQGWACVAPIVTSLLAGLVCAAGLRSSWLKALEEGRLAPTMLWSSGLALWGAFSGTAFLIAAFYPAGGQIIGRVLGILVSLIFCLGVTWTLQGGDPGRAQTSQVVRWMLWEVAAGAGLFTFTTPLTKNSADLQVYGSLLGGMWVVAGAAALLIEPLRFWYATQESIRAERRDEERRRWERRSYVLKESQHRVERMRRRRRPWG